ncbi:MAG: serine protease [Rubripirellula sp.]
MKRNRFIRVTSLAFFAFASSALFAQSVCLPAPRLLTTMPMGGKAGTEVEVSITGQYIEDASLLHFSSPLITATQQVNAEGDPVDNSYPVKIDAACPAGIYEASVMTRLGLSASRVFSVGNLTELTQTKSCTTVATALPITINSVCNATIPARSVNHYSFAAKQGQRLIVDCAAKGIESKLNPVLIVADESGADLVVDLRGGGIDFTVPDGGNDLVKVHELTFKGGSECFFRLHLREGKPGDVVARPPATNKVSAFSWPPHGLTAEANLKEVEPNNDQPQQIELPCDLMGSFAVAADVDTYEFAAKKGEVWWVEVASERLGLPTDPSVIVQHVDTSSEIPVLTDVAELSDIKSPVKVSSNGYSYDGPPYNAGSSDVLGKFEIKQDGIHRLQISDLFGGTRNDPRNVYRLIVRRAAPDFALVGWGLHMGLRNGDRNALSKPMALRPGATIALEVVAIRRDGFAGEIDLEMANLPDGVTSAGLKLAAGQSRGMLLVTAAADAPVGISKAELIGRSKIGEQTVTRTCHLASMSWPVTNHRNEIPAPRLLADVTVSVGSGEAAPLSIAAKDKTVIQATVGQSVKIALVHQRRCEFSGATMSLSTMGAGFEKNPKFDLSLTSDNSEVTLDLAKLKTKPGDYQIAFYGGAVAKYSHNPDAVGVAETLLASAKRDAVSIDAEVKRLAAELKSVTEAEKPAMESAIKKAKAKQQASAAIVSSVTKKLAAAKKLAKQKDIVDIVVSEPISIRVNPAETK